MTIDPSQPPSLDEFRLKGEDTAQPDPPMRWTVRASYVLGGWKREAADLHGLGRLIRNGLDASPTGEVQVRLRSNTGEWPEDAPWLSVEDDRAAGDGTERHASQVVKPLLQLDLWLRAHAPALTSMDEARALVGEALLQLGRLRVQERQHGDWPPRRTVRGEQVARDAAETRVEIAATLLAAAINNKSALFNPSHGKTAHLHLHVTQALLWADALLAAAQAPAPAEETGKASPDAES